MPPSDDTTRILSRHTDTGHWSGPGAQSVPCLHAPFLDWKPGLGGPSMFREVRCWVPGWRACCPHDDDTFGEGRLNAMCCPSLGCLRRVLLGMVGARPSVDPGLEFGGNGSTRGRNRNVSKPAAKTTTWCSPMPTVVGRAAQKGQRGPLARRSGHCCPFPCDDPSLAGERRYMSTWNTRVLLFTTG